MRQLVVAWLFLLVAAASLAQGKIATTTTLTLTTNAGSNSSVASGTLVTLTATVSPASGASPTGQVKFCDASSQSCTDIHLLGVAQLTGAGKASIKFQPGIGSHSYKAVFAGTNTEAASSSSVATLTVTGSYPTTATILQQGQPNSYTLMGTVTGIANTPSAPPPTGNISFIDTSNKNAVLGTEPLGSLTRVLSFLNVSSPATVPEPNVVVAADFNGDGFADLAVSNSNSGGTELSILLGNGDGTFRTVSGAPTVGLYPDAIIAADFNGDGITDLAVNSVDQNLVTILLGKGDGHFINSPDLNTGSTPQDVQTGDFNGDGIADLVVVNANAALIFLGNGDGSFTQAATSPDLGGTPIKVAVGDYNNDGVADLAITDQGQTGSVLIFLGKGDGTFTAVDASPVAGSSPFGIAAGDFNGDGNLDLAVSQSDGITPDAVAILLGNGNGTFQPATNFGAGSSEEAVVVADFNGDGIADLVFGQISSGLGPILLGKGDGTFEAVPPTPASVPSSSGYLAAADFNGDGVPDLAAPNQVPTGTVVILLTQNTLTQTATLNHVAPAGPGLHEVAAHYSGDSSYQSSTSPTTELQSQVATPVLSLSQGTYTTVQTLTMSDSTPGATIYYQAQGGMNTTGYVAYTGPVTISSSGVTLIQAYASETGYLQSSYASASYTLVLPPTAAPTISLASGYYAGAQTVTISDSAAGAKIYYTTNGSYPTPNATLYTGPITVSSSESLVAAAIAYGYSPSPATSANYVIGSAQASLIYTVAGTGDEGYTGDGGPATLADMNSPSGVARDAAGNLYICDIGSHVVRKVAAGTGTISTIAGTGTEGFSGDGGQGTAAMLEGPTSIALDTVGNLFIVDRTRIRKLNLASGIISTYAGNPNATASGDGGPAIDASLSEMGEIAIDASRNVYIPQGNTNTIRVINDTTGIINTIAGTGFYGFSGDGGPASAASFSSPQGLTFDNSGNLYVVDSYNSVIRKIAAVNGKITASSVINTVAGTPPSTVGYSYGGYSGDGGPATSAQLNVPASAKVDSSGNLYIADTENGVVRRVAASTGIISTVAGNGPTCGSFSGDGNTATSAYLCYPRAIALDPAGNIDVAQSNAAMVREILAPATPPATQAAAPVFSIAAGTYPNSQTLTISDATPGAAIYVTLNGQAPSTAAIQRYGFPIEITGALTVQAVAAAPGYLTSANSSASYTVTSFAPTISTVAGNGNSGTSLTSGPALNKAFYYLDAIAFDKAGNMYLTDLSDDIVWMVSASTGTASVIAGTGIVGYQGDGGPATAASLNHPQGLAFDSAGNLYIADQANYAIRKINASTGIISTFAGGHPPELGKLGDGGPATSAYLNSPSGVAFDSADNLYIADTNNFRIRMVSAATGVITTIAGNGSYLDSGDGGAATQAGLVGPDFVTVDQAGNLYIGSLSEERIRKVTASTGLISTYVGVGNIYGANGDGGKATSAQIAVAGLSLDAAGNLYFANTPGEIREVNAATGIISRVAGNGFAGYSGDGGAAAVAGISGPTGIAFDAAGNLYFVDSLNFRVRKVTMTEQTAATPAFSVASGTYSTVQSVSLSDATPKATIYYTTDGSDPTTSSAAYAGPISVNATETLKAVAVAVDYNPSAIASAAYVLNLQAAAPSLTSLSPAFTSATSSAFTLTVNGAAFTAASTVYWGGSALTTQFVNASQLTAQVPATDVATAGITPVTVQTPAPGGGTSNALQFEVDTAGSGTPPSYPIQSVTVTAGASASYKVTLPGGATNVSVACLNLPTGAACSYSASNSTLTITTSASTPKGTYAITTVFTETLPGAAAALALLSFVLLPFAKAGKRNLRKLWIFAGMTLLLVAGVAIGCGGGSSGTNSPPPPQTHQATSSATVTLIVQ